MHRLCLLCLLFVACDTVTTDTPTVRYEIIERPDLVVGMHEPILYDTTGATYIVYHTTMDSIRIDSPAWPFARAVEAVSPKLELHIETQGYALEARIIAGPDTMRRVFQAWPFFGTLEVE